MKKLIAFSAVVLLVLPCGVAAQEHAAESKSGIALEVFQMTQALEELVSLLEKERSARERETELQKLAIAVDYLSFRHRRIEAKERELESMRVTRDRLEETVAKIEADPEAWGRLGGPPRKENSVSSSMEESEEDFRLKLFKERIEDLEGRIVAMETEINSLLGDLAELEDYVERKLELIR